MALLPKVPQMQRSVNGFRLNHTKSGVRFQRRESGNRKNAAWQDARRASKPRVILLDTNVVSEPMRPKPDRNVLAWLDAQVGESLYLSTVSLAELLLGIESLPSDKRRKVLAAALGQQIIALFGGRIVPFDLGAEAGRNSC